MYDILLALKVTATGTALALTSTQGGTAAPAVDVSNSDGSTTVTVDVPGLTAADLQKLPALIKEKLAELAAKAEAQKQAEEQAKQALEAAKAKPASKSAGELPAVATKTYDPSKPCAGKSAFGHTDFDPAYAKPASDKSFGHHWGDWGHWGDGGHWSHGFDGHHGWGHADRYAPAGFGYHG